MAHLVASHDGPALTRTAPLAGTTYPCCGRVTESVDRQCSRRWGQALMPHRSPTDPPRMPMPGTCPACPMHGGQRTDPPVPPRKCHGFLSGVSLQGEISLQDWYVTQRQRSTAERHQFDPCFERLQVCLKHWDVPGEAQPPVVNLTALTIGMRTRTSVPTCLIETYAHYTHMACILLRHCKV